jgi:hypothetical protein
MVLIAIRDYFKGRIQAGNPNEVVYIGHIGSQDNIICTGVEGEKKSV